MTANFASIEYDMKSKDPPTSQDEVLLKSCLPVSDGQTYFPNLMYQRPPSVPKYYAPDERQPDGGKCGIAFVLNDDDGGWDVTWKNNAFTIPKGRGAVGLFG